MTQSAPPPRAELDELSVKRAQRGEPAACRALVVAYQRPVFAILSRMLAPAGLRARVEDLAQETFLRVFRALPGFSDAGPARLSTWILTVATRLALDELSLKRPWLAPLDEARGLAGPSRADADSERRALHAAIARAVAELQADHRAVFLLREVHELAYEEIALALEIDIGTVKSRLSRARGVAGAIGGREAMRRKDETPTTVPELEDAVPVEEPSAGFADRVVAAWQREMPADVNADANVNVNVNAGAKGRRGAARRRVAWVMPLAAAAVVVMALALRGGGGHAPASGAHSGGARAELTLGARGIAVAEAGAVLDWRVAGGGAAQVNQPAGDVFYRVERGGPFVVRTPGGEVRVQGTCFRVEVSEMKKSVLHMGAGAALATAVLVTVYEGKVIFANERGQTALAAGERARAGEGRAPTTAEPARDSKITAAAASEPAAGITRDELLARDRTQRDELARLQKRLREVEIETAGAPPARSARGLDDKPFLSPTKDDLLELAKECRLKWDMPGIGVHPQTLGDKQAREAGLSDQERLEYNRISAEMNTRVTADLRAWYLEVTGDKAGADNLTPNALRDEVFSKSNDRDIKEAYRRIAQERAGLARPPANLKDLPAVERMQRAMSALGDSFEQELGRAIGPDRAHAMRTQNDGWGSKSISSYGCPE